eukprot:2974487-Pleurochrysis_carterae.AAC.1
MQQPSMLTWVYEGAERGSVEDDFSNVQLAKAGDVLKHDIFGLCTLLSEPCANPGSLMVMMHADNHIKELTKGHFQLHSSHVPTRTVPKK